MNPNRKRGVALRNMVRLIERVDTDILVDTLEDWTEDLFVMKRAAFQEFVVECMKEAVLPSAPSKGVELSEFGELLMSHADNNCLIEFDEWADPDPRLEQDKCPWWSFTWHEQLGCWGLAPPETL